MRQTDGEMCCGEGECASDGVRCGAAFCSHWGLFGALKPFDLWLLHMLHMMCIRFDVPAYICIRCTRGRLPLPSVARGMLDPWFFNLTPCIQCLAHVLFVPLVFMLMRIILLLCRKCIWSALGTLTLERFSSLFQVGFLLHYSHAAAVACRCGLFHRMTVSINVCSVRMCVIRLLLLLRWCWWCWWCWWRWLFCPAPCSRVVERQSRRVCRAVQARPCQQASCSVGYDVCAGRTPRVLPCDPGRVED